MVKNNKKNLKFIYELVVSEKFIVNEVVSESYATYVQTGELIIGGENSFPDRCGDTSKLILKVTPKNKKIPVKNLEFNGFSIVKKGDYVIAKIPKYETSTKYVIPEEDTFDFEESGSITLYYNRHFKEKESAIELKILSENKTILRTDRAVGYKSFIKEKK